MWCDRQLTSFSFVFPLPNTEITWSAYGKCCNHFFYKVATAHFVLCISSSLLKTTKNVGVRHYIWWFHCCSNFVVYYYYYLKSFLYALRWIKLYEVISIFFFGWEKSSIIASLNGVWYEHLYEKLSLTFKFFFFFSEVMKTWLDNFSSNGLNLS